MWQAQRQHVFWPQRFGDQVAGEGGIDAAGQPQHRFLEACLGNFIFQKFDEHKFGNFRVDVQFFGEIGETAVRTEDAHSMALFLARQEGLFVGISAAAAVVAALQVARELDEGVVVTVLPDNGFKYLSERFWKG